MIKGKFGNTLTFSYSESWRSDRIKNLAFSRHCMASHAPVLGRGFGSRSSSWITGVPSCGAWQNRWNGSSYRQPRERI